MAVLLVGGIVASADGARVVEVAQVESGDSVGVREDGSEFVVELLNVDVPPSGDCLGPDAVDFLEQFLPPGTEVELQNSSPGGSGREWAGVFLDGTLVNAEIARAGYGYAVIDGSNRTYYDEVLTAQREAEAAGRGIYSTENECTLAGRVQAYVAASAEFDSGHAALLLSEDLAHLERRAAAMGAAAVVGGAVGKALDGGRDRYPLAAFDDTALWNMRGQVRAADTLIAERSGEVQARIVEVERIQAERAEAERLAREEAERLAREEAERQAAAEAARIAAEEAAAAAAAAASRAQAPSSGSGSSGSSGGSAYYANCSAARAAGAAPILRGQPGYRSALDRDNDGVACE